MAGVTAHVTDESVTLTSKRKGEIGNFIRYKKVVAGITGASTVAVSGLDITVSLKSTDGAASAATMGEVFSAISGSADAQRLITAVQVGASGATGVAFTGTGGAFVNAVSGAETGTAIEYDDLAGMSGAWKTFSGPSGTVVAERIRGANSAAPGTVERQSTVANTGSATLAVAAGRTNTRLAAKGAIGPSDF